MKVEIKYTPLGKGHIVNNCFWPLPQTVHSQLPLITSSYIYLGRPKKALACSMQHWLWTSALSTNAAWSLAVTPTPDTFSSWQISNNNCTRLFQLHPNSSHHGLFNIISDKQDTQLVGIKERVANMTFDSVCPQDISNLRWTQAAMLGCRSNFHQVWVCSIRRLEKVSH